MYAWAVPTDVAKEAQVDLKLTEEQHEQREKLAYWRKFNHLHGWMKLLYMHKQGKSRDFNCNSVRLNPEDLTALELALEQNQLYHMSGFFFGDEKASPEQLNSVHVFILDARNAIEKGKAVFYDSWW